MRKPGPPVGIPPGEARTRTPPWRKKNPHRGSSRKLSPAQREAARERAAKAGRPYPNLIDNMWAARHVARDGGPET